MAKGKSSGSREVPKVRPASGGGKGSSVPAKVKFRKPMAPPTKVIPDKRNKEWWWIFEGEANEAWWIVGDDNDGAPD